MAFFVLTYFRLLSISLFRFYSHELIRSLVTRKHSISLSVAVLLFYSVFFYLSWLCAATNVEVMSRQQVNMVRQVFFSLLSHLSNHVNRHFEYNSATFSAMCTIQFILASSHWNCLSKTDITTVFIMCPRQFFSLCFFLFRKWVVFWRKSTFTDKRIIQGKNEYCDVRFNCIELFFFYFSRIRVSASIFCYERMLYLSDYSILLSSWM